MANRDVSNIVSANNVFLLTDCLRREFEFSSNDWGICRYPGCFKLVGETKINKESHVMRLSLVSHINRYPTRVLLMKPKLLQLKSKTSKEYRQVILVIIHKTIDQE